MQRIERYGVIALVFLLVTILAVSLWGEREGLSLTPDDSVAVAPARPAAQRPTPARQQPQSRPAPAQRRGPALSDQTAATSAQRTGARRGPTTQPATFRQPGARRAGRGPAAPSILPADSGAAPSPEARVATAPARTEREVGPARTGSLTPAGPARTVLSPAATAPAGGAREYVVQRGDTLGEIALKQLGTSKRWKEIQTLNGGIDPRKVRPGMKLLLPGGGAAIAQSTPAAPQAQPQAAPVASGGSYTVRPGDTLGEIALRQLGTSKRWTEIRDLNPGIDPNRLIVGNALRLPTTPLPASAGSALARNDAPRPAAKRGGRVR